MIDFLNPRKPREPRNDRLRYSVVGGLAAAVLLLIGYLAWNNVSSRDAQIADLQTQLGDMAQSVEASNEQAAKVARIDEFLGGNVVWLDEIRRVATEMPPSDQAILTSLSAMVPPREGGGQLTLAGAVTSPDVIDAMEASLRDDQHRVIGEGATAARTDGPYDWGFRETVVVEPAVVREMRRQADLAAPAGATVEAEEESTGSESEGDEPPAQETDADDEETPEQAVTPSPDDELSDAEAEGDEMPVVEVEPEASEPSAESELPAESDSPDDNETPVTPAESETPTESETPAESESEPLAESETPETDGSEPSNQPVVEVEDVQ